LQDDIILLEFLLSFLCCLFHINMV